MTEEVRLLRLWSFACFGDDELVQGVFVRQNLEITFTTYFRKFEVPYGVRHLENTNIYDWQFVIGRKYVSRAMDNLRGVLQAFCEAKQIEVVDYND